VPRQSQAETREKFATASSFIIAYEKSEGNSIECSIAKPFPEQNNFPKHRMHTFKNGGYISLMV